MSSRISHRTARWATLLMAATAALGLTAAAPAQAGNLPMIYPGYAQFWETPSFDNDGVTLGLGAHELLRVTRDCVFFCWNDWNNVPSSLNVGPNTWLTVWDGEGRTGDCIAFWGGEPVEYGAGRAWDDLTRINAGPASGDWSKRISYITVITVSAYEDDRMTNCPEAVWR
ncbi:hypothetical protein [Nocardia brasiliensis]|uniref:Secreted protein n=1 Tax=Nocardia brasiliensis (strain ATCC 700358 / HUJEG-1) TaxID=1133849 RepID=K0FET7_NOCB7|nr:hypothetical protein [Nocardia brasiliensis]AFU06241.1 hypothetical protein O3I_041480 [Nocardia brasiliensis ATCC 700358]OCF88581.1 hypothetical protein AW168_19825 [Nocardia brasiliensis]